MWWLDTIIDSIDMNLSKLKEIVKDRESWLLQSMGLQSPTRHSDWTAITKSWGNAKMLEIAHLKLSQQSEAYS